MIRARGMLAAAVLLAAGCTTATAPVDTRIDFVRGCWVQKPTPGGEAQAFLRLLPREGRLAGQIAHVRADSWKPDAGISFTQAGDSADFSLTADAPLQTDFSRINPARLGASFEWARPQFGGELAAYAEATPSRKFLFAEASAERLAIWSVDAAADSTLIFKLFDGERDGCD
ncbi:MAG: hypothetical protein QM773_06060 [Hyphomonadaceae bacterium]